ncbi:glycosyltransferase family 2 protein [Candidatus Woesearchaeota archaeon]|nr:glycosyltransferase family 2 protein [Candidatus Woesearchaeota archaeon]
MVQDQKLSIIIPVYNEEAYVAQLLDRVLAVKLPSLSKEVIIIESNSTDGTREIVKKYEKNKEVKVFYQEKPLGKGNALKLGFQHATGIIILIQDADLEYQPEEYGKLLEPILSGQTSFVLGSRPLAKESWTIRKYPGYFFYARLLNLGGFFYTMLFNALYFIWLTDPATMFKVFKKECISGLTFKSNYFDLDWELVSKLVRKGYSPVEVPVSYHSRSTAEGKKIRFLRDGILVFWAILRYRFFD